MDHNKPSVKTFDRLAREYQTKNGPVTLYDDSNQLFCDLLRNGTARGLDAACGPGNITKFLLTRRPALEVPGIDLAPAMVDLATSDNPGADFAVHDCRDLLALGGGFDGVVCGFGLPYLSAADVARFIGDSAKILNAQGVLYFSVMEGTPRSSGFETYRSGDQVFIYYHAEDALLRELQACGFKLIGARRKRSPNPGGTSVTECS